jgi:membrane fusion protein, copper/silver efflux system
MQIKFSRLKPFLSVLPLMALVVAVTALVLWPRSKGEQTASGDWTCSMHPQVRMPKPGKCPICGMPLVPVSQLKSLNDRAGVETELVTRRELFKEIRTVGKIDYNETRVADITARIDGRVDRLFVDFTGIDVELNDHLVDIYSPSLVVAQEELLRSLDAFERQRPAGTGIIDAFVQENLQSARDKLRLWGILPEQITEIEKTRERREHVTLYAPIRGTVIERNVRVGQYVKEGDLLYRIAELDPIWLYLDTYEFDIAWVRYGQSVDVSLEAMPGATIRGMVTFIDPFLNESTRTVKVRVNLQNADRRLKPGMYASASIRVRLNADGRAAPTGLEGKFACPMHPEVIQDEPGTCSVCQMQLKQVPQSGPFAYVDQTADPHTARAGPEGHAAHDSPTRPAVPVVAAPDRVIEASTAWPLAIRASAVLDTGRRKIAYRKRADGAVELVRLTVGPRAVGTDDQGRAGVYFTVLDGLQEKDEVVVRAGFLLDSQRQIEGMPGLFFPEGAPAARHQGHADQG